MSYSEQEKDQLRDGFLQLARAVCTRLGIDPPPAYGAQARVLEELNRARASTGHSAVGKQQFSDCLRGRSGSYDTLFRWAGALGISVMVSPKGEVELTDRSRPDEEE